MRSGVHQKELNPAFRHTEQEADYREFRLLAELIPHLAWIAQADGWIRWYNQRWYEFTGTTPKDMEGWGWQSVHDPYALAGVLDRWQASIRTGEPFELTFPLRRADGVFRIFLTRVMPLKDDHGEVLQWFGTNTDISEQRQAVVALGESEQRFRIATEAVSGVLWTNSAAGEMHGEQVGWSGFTGQTLEQYQGYGWAAAVHPADAQATIDAWQEAVRENRLFSFEHRVRRHDGVYRLCSIRALPVPNEDGSVREWVGVHTDITESRRTQVELEETVVALNQQKEFVEAAQLTTNVGFWRYQPSNGDFYLSPGSRQLLRLPLTGAVTFEQSLAAIHPEETANARRALETSLETGQYRLEFRAAEASGEPERHLLAVARAVHLADGTPYFVGMHLDVTEQKRSMEMVMRTERLAVAGRLAATIAHEINNPLEAVTNLLYLLTQSKLDEEQQGYCRTMSEELQRVSEITTNTLRFHRQSSRQAPIQCDNLLRSVLTLYDGRLRKAGITPACKLRDGCEVDGFEGELRQVCANLVGNAIDALAGLREGACLYLRNRKGRHWRTGASGVIITVADTGTGMTASTLQRIFDPFYTTKGEGGTGLGLWVSSEIVRKHKGDLSVRSNQRARHHGTVFRLFLPSPSSIESKGVPGWS